MRHSPLLRRILARNATFVVPAMPIWALLPLIATERLSLDAGRPVAARGSYPGWFHEMSAVTVPAHVRKFRASVLSEAQKQRFDR